MEPPKMQLRQEHFANNNLAVIQQQQGSSATASIAAGGATTPASGSSSSTSGAGCSSLHTSSSIDGTVDDNTTNTINDDHLLLSPTFPGSFSLGQMVSAQSSSSMLSPGSGPGPSENQRSSMYRLSSFKPMLSASSDLIRDSGTTNGNSVGQTQINSVTTPTYESIDVQNLSSHHLHHLGYYPRTAGSDYCPGSSGSSMGHHSLSAPFVDDDCVGIDDGQQHRLYPGVPLLGRNGGRYLARGGPGILGYNLSDLSNVQLGSLARYPCNNRCSPDQHHHHHNSHQHHALHHHLHNQHHYQQQQQSQQLVESDPTGNSYCYYPTYGRPVYPRGAAKEEDFDIFNAIFALISLTSYMVTFGVALVLAYFFAYHEQNHRMFVLTLGTVLLPSAIVNILSLKWLLADNQRQQQLQLQQQKSPELESIYEEVKRPDIGPCGWMVRILLHVLLLGPIVRYIELLRYGVKSWNVKRKIEQRKDTWQSALPTLSTSLPCRPRYTSAKPGEGLPNFEPATSQLVGRLKSPHSASSSNQSTSGTSSVDSSLRSSPIDYYLLTVYEDRDCSLLSLFQSLMQCSVQLILQLVSIMAHHQHFFQPQLTAQQSNAHVHEHEHLTHAHPTHHNHHDNHRHLQPTIEQQLPEQYRHPFTEYVQMVVIATSLFELSWSVASYQRALRRVSYEKRNQSPIATVLQTLWQAGLVASRSIAVALFIGQFGYWLCPVAIGHWGVMTVWIMHQGTHFFDDPSSALGGSANQLQEYLFNMIIGAIYLFVFVNVKDEPTRYKYAWFYSITGAESFLFTLLWFLRVDTVVTTSGDGGATITVISDLWFRIAIAGTVLTLFVLGLVWMQIYYWFAHPNGRPLLINKAARCC